MGSVLRALKDSSPALWVLTRMCRRQIDQARAAGDYEALTSGPVVYALERRILEHLQQKDGWGFNDSTPEAIRSAYAALRDALAFIIANAPDGAASHFNRTLNNLEKRAKSVELKSYPWRVYFEPTNQCNLRCKMCGQSFYHGDRSTVPLDAFQRIQPTLKYVQELSLFGFGETLLIDYMKDMLAAVPDYTHSMLITNGILLSPENNRMLVDSGLKRLTISLDAIRPDTYKAIRHVNQWENIVGHIKDMVAYKKAVGADHPHIQMSFVAMRRNIEQLPDFIRLAQELGVSSVSADYMTAYSEEIRDQSLFYSQELSDRYVDEAIRTAEEVGMEFQHMPKFSDPTKKTRAIERCFEPWEFLYYRADGFIMPCCVYNDKTGSWLGKDFHSYWNSLEMRKLRNTIGTEKETEPCKSCFHVYYRDVTQEHSHVHILPESIPQIYA
ncbi:radical SAM protein [Candidatus Sumerlaeota bacterium]|nr:radical SAM protein [Candidatus Sumerlaeota bacterium]